MHKWHSFDLQQQVRADFMVDCQTSKTLGTYLLVNILRIFVLFMVLGADT